MEAPGAVERVWVDRCGVVDRIKDPQAVQALAERQQAALEWTVERYRASYDAPLQRHFRSPKLRGGDAGASD
jgi:hypothetical protein|eukprot:COSAG02_NODE_9713_length_2135_cov_1.691552_3_plen_72_part_00